MSLKEGDSLPDFALPSDGGTTVTAQALRGQPLVLYFYPRDDTPACTKEAQAFRDAMDDFAAAGVRIVGVSTDSASSHDKFKAKHNLNFVLLADTEATLAQACGVWVEKSMYGKKYMGLERATFLVDANGLVRKVWRKVKVPGHAAEVLAAARGL